MAIDPWHLNPVPAREQWTDEQLAKHQAELLSECDMLNEMNDPHNRLPRIQASLSRTEVEMMKRALAR